MLIISLSKRYYQKIDLVYLFGYCKALLNRWATANEREYIGAAGQCL
jgi:hypothetical protein